MQTIVRLFIFLFTVLYSINSVALDYTSHIPSNPSKALIVLHGWHQNKNSLQWLTNRLKDDFPDMAFYYPTAPDNAPGGGYEWFTIPTLGSQMSEEKMYKKMMSSALDNVEYLHNLIDSIHQNQAIEYENIHIAGFSQGGFMSILSGLLNNEKIGKIISFSGVPILFTEDFTAKDVRTTPQILIIQGDNDIVIPIDSYNMTDKTLQSINIKADVKIIKNMPHTINETALRYAKDFLKE